MRERRTPTSPPRGVRFRWVLRLVGALAALALVASACGDDDDEDAASDTTDTTEAQGDLAAFCDAIIQVDAAFAAGGPEGPDPASLEPAFQAAQRSAPAEVADDVETAISLTQESFLSGEEPPPELDEADGRIDRFALSNCDFEEVDVTAVDYGFEDLPETLDAGKVAVNLTNEGDELHEIALLRINDDVTEPFEELLQLEEEEALTKVTIAGVGFAPPGGSGLTFVDLEPGRYGATCFIPVGSTPEAGEEVEGPPHFTEGMFAELTVE